MVALGEAASVLIVGGSDYGTVTQLWDIGTQTPVAGSLGASTYAEGIALTRDRTFAAVSFRGGVSVWETASDTLRYRLPNATAACAASSCVSALTVPA